MAALRDLPLFTREADKIADLVLEENVTYIYALSTEERSRHVAEFTSAATKVTFVELKEEGTTSFSVSGVTVSTRKRRDLEGYVRTLGRDAIYLDITGLSHNIWAPLVRVLVEQGKLLRVVYVEPRDYAHNPAPRQGDIFDLSERILGLSPIPLFASLADTKPEQVCFIALLGFEGARLSHMLEQVQPSNDKTFPLVGAPGFRPEYPFFAVLGNSIPLQATKAYRNLRFAQSNCPFSAYYVIRDIISSNPSDLVKIGLVGTKPHALAAVLHAMRDGDSVELVYDQAQRKMKRTSGVSRCLVYDLSEFLPYCGLPTSI